MGLTSSSPCFSFVAKLFAQRSQTQALPDQLQEKLTAAADVSADVTVEASSTASGSPESSSHSNCLGSSGSSTLKGTSLPSALVGCEIPAMPSEPSVQVRSGMPPIPIVSSAASSCSPLDSSEPSVTTDSSSLGATVALPRLPAAEPEEDEFDLGSLCSAMAVLEKSTNKPQSDAVKNIDQKPSNDGMDVSQFAQPRTPSYSSTGSTVWRSGGSTSVSSPWTPQAMQRPDGASQLVDDEEVIAAAAAAEAAAAAALRGDKALAGHTRTLPGGMLSKPPAEAVLPTCLSNPTSRAMSGRSTPTVIESTGFVTNMSPGSEPLWPRSGRPVAVDACSSGESTRPNKPMPSAGSTLRDPMQQQRKSQMDPKNMDAWFQRMLAKGGNKTLSPGPEYAQAQGSEPWAFPVTCASRSLSTEQSEVEPQLLNSNMLPSHQVKVLSGLSFRLNVLLDGDALGTFSFTRDDDIAALCKVFVAEHRLKEVFFAPLVTHAELMAHMRKSDDSVDVLDLL